MGVPQPPESIKDGDVKRYHIHFSPFIRVAGMKDNKQSGRQRTYMPVILSLIRKGKSGTCFSV